MAACNVPAEYRLEPLREAVRFEDVTFAVLRKLPRATREEQAIVTSLYDQAARIQGPCWNEPPFEWVPPHCLQALDAIGASSLAAYVMIQSRPRLVGMVCEMPAFEWSEGAIQPFIYSHLMAVSGADHLPIGHELKKLQRKEALSKGLSMIRWTYDPLQSLNANINIRKCGATCGIYKRGLYNLVGINAGIAADRFYVSWKLDSERVRERMEPENLDAVLTKQDDRWRTILGTLPCVNETVVDPEWPGFRLNARCDPDRGEPVLALEIPINFQDMIDKASASHAQPWRAAARGLFEGYFAKGYLVTDFVLTPDPDVPGARRAYYLLSREAKP